MVDPIKSIQLRHLSGKMMVMLMNRLVETFGQILQDISSLRPLLPRCSPGQNNLGVHSRVGILCYPAARHVLQCCYVITSQLAHSSLGSSSAGKAGTGVAAVEQGVGMSLLV